MLVDSSAFGKTAAVFCKIFDALALPLETVMLPLFASELFGNKSFEKTVGFFVAANYAGYAISAPLANCWFDVSGNYDLPITLFLFLMIAVFIAMNIVCKKARRDKELILKNVNE